MSPQRIQRRSTKGWRMPEGAVYVGRGSQFGNPYTADLMKAHLKELATIGRGKSLAEKMTQQLVVEAFEQDLAYGPDSRWWWYGPHMQIIQVKRGLQEGLLKGKDLACWCPLDQPCHADVLIALANPPGERQGP